jgi:hypothetical protein
MKIKRITCATQALRILRQSESVSSIRESTVHGAAEALSFQLEPLPRFPVSVVEVPLSVVHLKAGLPPQSLVDSPGSVVEVREPRVVVAVRLEAQQVAEVSPAANE